MSDHHLELAEKLRRHDWNSGGTWTSETSDLLSSAADAIEELSSKLKEKLDFEKFLEDEEREAHIEARNSALDKEY